MIIIFKERKADGIPPEKEFSVVYLDLNDVYEEYVLDESDRKNLIDKAVLGVSQVRNEFCEGTCPTCGNAGNKNLKNRTYVSFSVPFKNIFIYWFEEIQRWVGFSFYSEWESSHSTSECHDGPFQVNGLLAEKLLEGFGIDPKIFQGDALHMPPKELEKLSR